MRVEGTYIFPGATSHVFATLTNPDALARAIPGCERFIQFGPASDDGQTAYEARLRLGQSRQTYSTTVRVAATREPDYIRFELRGFGPSGVFSGEGSLDLVAQGGHTLVAYRLTLSGPDLHEAADAISPAGSQMARAACAHLAGDLHSQADESDEAYAASAMAADARRLDLAALSGQPAWSERAIWMGAGLALGLGAIALTVAVARRLSGLDGSGN
jgi:carbon monoxide dehydrogenase subunit G